jgi:glutathione S-transferase
MFISFLIVNKIRLLPTQSRIFMKLFYSPGACSLAPHIVLREAGLPFLLEKVDTAKHVTTSGSDYFAVNPKGQVPVLELDDGTRLTEGPVIAQFIGDQATKKTLMPVAGSMARYRVMEWQNYITSELHKSFTPLFNSGFDATAKSLHAKLLLKKYLWVDGQLAKYVSVEGHLARTKYLSGDDFTVADAYLFTVTGWAKHVNLDLLHLPHLQRFLADVVARPAVREAMKAEGLLA